MIYLFIEPQIVIPNPATTAILATVFEINIAKLVMGKAGSIPLTLKTAPQAGPIE